METSISEIEEFKKYVTTTRHSKRLSEQRIDQEFYNDTFQIPIPEFVDAKYIFRGGFIPSMANSISQQAIAYKPKVYTETRTKAAQAGADRVANICNHWCNVLSKQAYNPFRDTFKDIAFTCGESWIYVPHNDVLTKYLDGDWREVFPEVMPVSFILYDPMVIFHEPSEDVDGRPSRVVVSYRRKVGELKRNYPLWTPRVIMKDSEEVDFWIYYDDKNRYAKADEKPIFFDAEGELANGDGKRGNPYGFVPFVHKYSGYGRRNQSQDPELLAFTRTRMIRDKVKEDAKMSTEFNYNQSELVWKIVNLLWPLNTPIPEDLLTYYNKKPGSLNVLTVPSGVAPTVEESKSLGADAFAYWSRIRADLNAEHPASLRGVASGESGRQEDILSSAGMGMYDSPIEANAALWAEAFDMAIKMCGIEELNIKPKGMELKDKDSYSELRVDIKKDDLVARDRKIMAGRVMVNDGQMSLQRHLTENVGLTKEEADGEIDEILAERLMFQSPDIAAFLGYKAAQHSGMAEELEAYTQMVNQKTNNTKSLVGTTIGSKGGQPRTGNIQTPTGMEQADVGLKGLGIRSTPQ